MRKVLNRVVFLSTCFVVAITLKILSKFGLVLENFEFTDFILPKKHQKTYIENKKKAKKENDSSHEEEIDEKTKEGHIYSTYLNKCLEIH